MDTVINAVLLLDCIDPIKNPKEIPNIQNNNLLSITNIKNAKKINPINEIVNIFLYPQCLLNNPIKMNLMQQIYLKQFQNK